MAKKTVTGLGSNIVLCQWKHLLFFKCKVEKIQVKKLALTVRHPLLPASQHLDNILTGEEKRREIVAECGLGCIFFSRLSEKKQAGLCFESLRTCLGHNNSPDDACLASVRLILPSTHSAPRHLNHFYLFLYPASPPPHTAAIFPTVWL